MESWRKLSIIGAILSFVPVAGVITGAFSLIAAKNFFKNTQSSEKINGSGLVRLTIIIAGIGMALNWYFFSGLFFGYYSYNTESSPDPLTISTLFLLISIGLFIWTYFRARNTVKEYSRIPENSPIFRYGMMFLILVGILVILISVWSGLQHFFK